MFDTNTRRLERIDCRWIPILAAGVAATLCSCAESPRRERPRADKPRELEAQKQTAIKPPRGLYARDGVLMHNGSPYRGVGVNCFSLLYRAIKNPGDDTAPKRIAELSEAGIPFARFMCCGFWPVDWDLYKKDRPLYFKKLDEIVRAAEKHNVGLIPSLFWYKATLPDLAGEPMDCLGDPNSKCIAMMREYVRDVVSRYKESSAIWGWEMGNEYNLSMDLPNASSHRPKIVPKLGTPSTRSARDEFTSSHMKVVCREFARAVRAIDPDRIIITGNSIPRASAFHNTLEKSWTQDTPEEFGLMLERDNPDPFDVISVHIYDNKGGKYPGMAKSLRGMVEVAAGKASEIGKPLFVGEFGAPKTLGPERERAVFTELLASLVDNDIPLSAVWVFDHSNQDKDWNITFDNERSYMLKMVADANARLRGRMK